jgi:hypothetical protein
LIFAKDFFHSLLNDLNAFSLSLKTLPEILPSKRSSFSSAIPHSDLAVKAKVKGHFKDCSMKVITKQKPSGDAG